MVPIHCFVFFVIGVFSGIQAQETKYYKEKPDFVKTCYHKEPQFEECSKEAVQGLFNALGDGLPEIGIPSLDPLYIPKIRILQGEGPVNVNAALDNVTITGFSSIIIRLSKVDRKTYDFFTKIRLPKIKISGIYNLRGRILLLPLVGKGNCWFEPTNMDIDVKSDVKLYEKGGFTFFNVTAVHVKFGIEGLRLRMDNLFDGIKALEESTNDYLNANWRPVSESLRPILTSTIEDILLDILQRLFHSLPANFMVGDVKIHNKNQTYV